jgi:uncharacterized protein YbjT (DUF2867 family)
MSRILLAGATGLVGFQTLQHLESDDLHTISRRPVAAKPSGIEAHIAEIADWPSIIAEAKPDVVICCLGTTIKTAGSKEAFAAVDFGLVTSFATAAKTAGARHMIAISSIGASANAASFYLAIKGQTEAALQALAFERLDILRPGLLRGNREEIRSGEALGIMLSPVTDALMHGPLRRYRSIASAVVAKAIANLAHKGGHGSFIHENDAIAALAG